MYAKMETTCTWVDCKHPAEHPQTAADGVLWANLCHGHLKALQDAINDPDTRKLLSAWVRAGGGAKTMASRFV